MLVHSVLSEFLWVCQHSVADWAPICFIIHFGFSSLLGLIGLYELWRIFTIL